jgi:AcrR family transcriptional regulator
VNRTSVTKRPNPAPTEPRRALNRQRVLETAIGLADSTGFESLTMRKLADELGAGVMSLYHYFPGKHELLDGMIDVVFAEIELPGGGGDWRAAMRPRARSTREVLKRHPWAVGLMESRRSPGIASLRLHDAVLGCLRDAGFTVEQTVEAYSVLDAYIYGFALQEQTVPFETRAESAAVAEEQAREFAALAAERRLGDLADEFPHLHEVVAGHVARVGYDFATAFEDGLDLILDALERRRLASE